MSKKNTIFYLGNLRSGTKYLASFIRRNAKDITALHEPQPDMFGFPIMERHLGHDRYTRGIFNFKRRMIQIFSKKNYFESNHAFLKSFSDIAMEFFPDMKLIHSIRNPVEVAQSAVNRRILTEKYIPFRCIKTYKYQKDTYWRWSFTGKESLFQHIKPEEITLFQWYLLEWIEVENRSVKFLDQYRKWNDCYTLHVPRDLESESKMSDLLKFMGVQPRRSTLDFHVNRNPNHCTTNLSDRHYDQLNRLLKKLPPKKLEFLYRETYRKTPWIHLFDNP